MGEDVGGGGWKGLERMKEEEDGRDGRGCRRRRMEGIREDEGGGGWKERMEGTE